MFCSYGFFFGVLVCFEAACDVGFFCFEWTVVVLVVRTFQVNVLLVGSADHSFWILFFVRVKLAITISCDVP